MLDREMLEAHIHNWSHLEWVFGKEKRTTTTQRTRAQENERIKMT